MKLAKDINTKQPTQEEIILRRAANVILKNNFCKGTYAKTKTGAKANCYRPEAAKFCMLGAIRKATDELSIPHLYVREKAEDQLQSYISSTYPNREDILMIAELNDKPGFTKENAIHTLREAASHEE